MRNKKIWANVGVIQSKGRYPPPSALDEDLKKKLKGIETYGFNSRALATSMLATDVGDEWSPTSSISTRMIKNL